MKIDKIQKMNNGKYKLILDTNDKITTYDDVILKNNLLFGKEISFEDLKELNNQTTYYDIYHKIIKMISTKYRSEKEIRKFLKDKELKEEEKESIIQKLKETGMISDIRFMKAYINDRMHLSTDGPFLIQKSLLDHGIEASIIEEELSNIPEEDLLFKINKLVLKKIKSNTKYSAYVLKQKLVQTMIQKGYDSKMIIAVFDSCNKNYQGILEKEYKKQFTKLSKKHEGNELYAQIKKKLYSKGFSSSEIETAFQNLI